MLEPAIYSFAYSFKALVFMRGDGPGRSHFREGFCCHRVPMCSKRVPEHNFYVNYFEAILANRMSRKCGTRCIWV